MMKLYIYINVLFIATCLFASCNNNSSLEKELEAKKLELKQRDEELLNNRKKDLDTREQQLDKEKAKIEQVKKAAKSFNYYAKGYGNYPQGSERYLTYDDIANLNQNEIKLMRNEIFARHGYIFKTPEMVQYFSGQSWYKPLLEDVTIELTTVEKENVNYLKAFE